MTSRVLTALMALLLVAPPALAGGFVLREHGFYLLDFVLLFGALLYFVRGPAKKFLVERHDAARREMEEATALKAQAQERLERYEAMLAELAAEAQRLQVEFREAGERERDRIIAEAEARAERIRRDAEATLAAESAQTKHDIELQIGAMAIERAEGLIRQRMNAERQKALVRSFIDDLESRGDLSSFTA